MAVRWRIAILLAVITTINYVDRSVFGVVAPVVRGEFGIGVSAGRAVARAQSRRSSAS